jgi:acyl-CoA thioester hydrolase
MIKFEKQIVVRESDIDVQSHVNNVVYIQWVQDVAVAHWNSIVPIELSQESFWVVLRHEIDYKAAALLGDELILKTYLGKLDVLKWERFTEVYRPKDDKLLAKARTLWSGLDAKTLRPKRIGNEFVERFKEYILPESV